MNLKRILFSKSLFMLCLAFTLMFEVKAGESQQKWNATLLVQDYARVFSPVQLDSLESKLSGFAMAASIELVIRTESSIGNSELFEFAMKQTDKMNLEGNPSMDRILLLIVMDKKESLIYPSPAIKYRLPDRKCSQITSQIIDPSFKLQQYDAGISSAIDAIIGTVKGEYNLKPVLNPEYSLKSFYVPILVLLLFIGGAVFFNLRTERQIQKAMHAYNLSYFDARIMLGIDRPSEVVGDGWEAFKGGGAKGDWS